MKVINYNYGYLPLFNCSIHGKLILTADEWKKAFRFLTSPSVKKSFLPSYPWANSQLLEDVKRTQKTKRGHIFNIRVPMTEKLAEHYGLKIKRANYMIEII